MLGESAIYPRWGNPMLNTIGITAMIMASVGALVYGAAMVNDPACAAVADHIPVIRAAERFLMLCWLV